MMDDFKFDDEVVMIRERKRRKDLAASTRQVPMHPKLKEVMQDWFKSHPGGQFTIATPLSMPQEEVQVGIHDAQPGRSPPPLQGDPC